MTSGCDRVNIWFIPYGSWRYEIGDGLQVSSDLYTLLIARSAPVSLMDLNSELIMYHNNLLALSDLSIAKFMPEQNAFNVELIGNRWPSRGACMYLLRIKYTLFSDQS